jgi:hypothetical protein
MEGAAVPAHVREVKMCEATAAPSLLAARRVGAADAPGMEVGMVQARPKLPGQFWVSRQWGNLEALNSSMVRLFLWRVQVLCA